MELSWRLWYVGVWSPEEQLGLKIPFQDPQHRTIGKDKIV